MGFADKRFDEITADVFTADEAIKLTRNMPEGAAKAELLKVLEKVVINYVGICSMLEDKGMEVFDVQEGELVWQMKQ